MLLSAKTRWLCIITGCFVAVVGVAGLGLGFALYPGILVIGAIVKTKAQKLGRGLLSAGALLLTFWVFDIVFFMLTEKHAASGIVLREAVIYSSAALVAACDVAIVIEESRIRRAVRLARKVQAHRLDLLKTIGT